jgi:hypothetical protein
VDDADGPAEPDAPGLPAADAEVFPGPGDPPLAFDADGDGVASGFDGRGMDGLMLGSGIDGSGSEGLTEGSGSDGLMVGRGRLGMGNDGSGSEGSGSDGNGRDGSGSGSDGSATALDWLAGRSSTASPRAS